MKLLLTAPLALLTYISHGQAYNNLQNYSTINRLIGCTRPTANAQMVKAGYKLMTYQEVCQKEGEAFPKDFFAITAHYRYIGRLGDSAYYFTLVFDPDHGNKAGAVEWNEYMTPGRGKVLDAVTKLYSFVQYDEIPGPTATSYYYKNDLRHLIFTGYPNNQLINFQIAINRGDLSAK